MFTRNINYKYSKYENLYIKDCLNAVLFLQYFTKHFLSYSYIPNYWFILYPLHKWKKINFRYHGKKIIDLYIKFNKDML